MNGWIQRFYITRGGNQTQTTTNKRIEKDASMERRIESKETLSDCRICYIDQQITTVYTRGKESLFSTNERHPRVHRKLFRYPMLFCSLQDEQDEPVRAHVDVRRCMITDGTICYTQYVFAVSCTFPCTSRCTTPCQYAPDEYRPTFCEPHSKVSPARAYPCNLVYLRIMFIRVSTINWPLGSFKVASIARADNLEVKFYLTGSVASIEVI